jgi:truncated hemoglobin YjbI
MANNRLYIVDPDTGEQLTLAKGWGDGWVSEPEIGAALESFLNGRERQASERGATKLRLQTEDEQFGIGERERWRAALAYAVAEADGWSDDASGVPVPGKRMAEVRRMLAGD